MSEEKQSAAATPSDADSIQVTLRGAISSTREFLCGAIASARVNSPFADDKLEAADNAVAGVIHTGYQAVKSILINGHPAIILTVSGIAAAVPSIPFGAKALVRNTGLAMALSSVLIYPDHLKTRFSTSSDPTPESS